MSSGIYLIINRINNKAYVGSAVNHEDRWRLHKLSLNLNNHHNRHLQAAWLNYGAENFEFRLIELTDDLLNREQFWIDKLNTCDHNIGYNICKAGRNRHGVKASDETRRKLSESHKGHKASAETKAKMSEARKGNTWNKGRTWSQEAIEKRRLGNTGKKRTPEQIKRIKAGQAKTRKPVSEETRVKMAISAKNRKKSID